MTDKELINTVLRAATIGFDEKGELVGYDIERAFTDSKAKRFSLSLEEVCKIVLMTKAIVAESFDRYEV